MDNYFLNKRRIIFQINGELFPRRIKVNYFPIENYFPDELLWISPPEGGIDWWSVELLAVPMCNNQIGKSLAARTIIALWLSTCTYDALNAILLLPFRRGRVYWLNFMDDKMPMLTITACTTLWAFLAGTINH